MPARPENIERTARPFCAAGRTAIDHYSAKEPTGLLAKKLAKDASIAIDDICRTLDIFRSLCYVISPRL